MKTTYTLSQADLELLLRQHFADRLQHDLKEVSVEFQVRKGGCDSGGYVAPVVTTLVYVPSENGILQKDEPSQR